MIRFREKNGVWPLVEKDSSAVSSKDIEGKSSIVTGYGILGHDVYNPKSDLVGRKFSIGIYQVKLNILKEMKK